MTLEELLGQKKVKGRTIETRDPDGFIFRARIRTAGKWDVGQVCFFLTDVTRKYKNSDSPWKHLGDFQLIVRAKTTAETGIDGSIMFPLSGGGRASILPGIAKDESNA
jgi:hypothetical protein